MKNTITALLALTLTFAAITASAETPATVTGESEQTITGYCSPESNLNEIDFAQGFADARQNAETKCVGAVKRISDYTTQVRCIKLPRVFNYEATVVTFSAQFNCESSL